MIKPSSTILKKGAIFTILLFLLFSPLALAENPKDPNETSDGSSFADQFLAAFNGFIDTQVQKNLKEYEGFFLSLLRADNINVMHPVIIRLAPLLIAMLIPFWELLIVMVAIYYIWGGLSPASRAAAKNMLTKLIIGMIACSLSMPIYQLFIDLNRFAVHAILTAPIGNPPTALWANSWDPISSTPVWGVLTVTGFFAGMLSLLLGGYGMLLLCPMACGLLAIMIMPYLVCGMRNILVLMLGAAFPVTIFFLSFDFTKGLGNKMMKMTLVWIFIPVSMAIFVALTYTFTQTNCTTATECTTLSLMALSSWFLVAGAPMMMTSLMSSAGAVFIHAGRTSGNPRMIFMGGVMRGQGPAALTDTAFYSSERMSRLQSARKSAEQYPTVAKEGMGYKDYDGAPSPLHMRPPDDAGGYSHSRMSGSKMWGWAAKYDTKGVFDRGISLGEAAKRFFFDKKAGEGLSISQMSGMQWDRRQAGAAWSEGGAVGKAKAVAIAGRSLARQLVLNPLMSGAGSFIKAGVRWTIQDWAMGQSLMQVGNRMTGMWEYPKGKDGQPDMSQGARFNYGYMSHKGIRDHMADEKMKKARRDQERRDKGEMVMSHAAVAGLRSALGVGIATAFFLPGAGLTVPIGLIGAGGAFLASKILARRGEKFDFIRKQDEDFDTFNAANKQGLFADGTMKDMAQGRLNQDQLWGKLSGSEQDRWLDKTKKADGTNDEDAAKKQAHGSYEKVAVNELGRSGVADKEDAAAKGDYSKHSKTREKLDVLERGGKTEAPDQFSRNDALGVLAARGSITDAQAQSLLKGKGTAAQEADISQVRKRGLNTDNTNEANDDAMRLIRQRESAGGLKFEELDKQTRERLSDKEGKKKGDTIAYDDLRSDEQGRLRDDVRLRGHISTARQRHFEDKGGHYGSAAVAGAMVALAPFTGGFSLVPAAYFGFHTAKGVDWVDKKLAARREKKEKKQKEKPAPTIGRKLGLLAMATIPGAGVFYPMLKLGQKIGGRNAKKEAEEGKPPTTWGGRGVSALKYAAIGTGLTFFGGPLGWAAYGAYKYGKRSGGKKYERVEREKDDLTTVLKNGAVPGLSGSVSNDTVRAAAERLHTSGITTPMHLANMNSQQIEATLSDVGVNLGGVDVDRLREMDQRVADGKTTEGKAWDQLGVDKETQKKLKANGVELGEGLIKPKSAAADAELHEAMNNAGHRRVVSADEVKSAIASGRSSITGVDNDGNAIRIDRPELEKIVKDSNGNNSEIESRLSNRTVNIGGIDVPQGIVTRQSVTDNIHATAKEMSRSDLGDGRVLDKKFTHLTDLHDNLSLADVETLQGYNITTARQIAGLSQKEIAQVFAHRATAWGGEKGVMDVAGEIRDNAMQATGSGSTTQMAWNTRRSDGTTQTNTMQDNQDILWNLSDQGYSTTKDIGQAYGGDLIHSGLTDDSTRIKDNAARMRDGSPEVDNSLFQGTTIEGNTTAKNSVLTAMANRDGKLGSAALLPLAQMTSLGLSDNDAIQIMKNAQNKLFRGTSISGDTGQQDAVLASMRGSGMSSLKDVASTGDFELQSHNVNADTMRVFDNATKLAEDGHERIDESIFANSSLAGNEAGQQAVLEQFKAKGIETTSDIAGSLRGFKGVKGITSGNVGGIQAAARKLFVSGSGKRRGYEREI